MRLLAGWIVKPNGICIYSGNNDEVEGFFPAISKANDERPPFRELLFEIPPFPAQGKRAQSLVSEEIPHIAEGDPVLYWLVKRGVDNIRSGRVGFPIVQHHCHAGRTTSIFHLPVKGDDKGVDGRSRTHGGYEQGEDPGEKVARQSHFSIRTSAMAPRAMTA